jgi:hypothetical protein
VTLVVNMLRVSPGAVLTAIGWVLGVFDWGTDAGALAVGALAGLEVAEGAEGAEAGAAEVVLLPELLPPSLPPPPQAVSTADSAPATSIRGTMRIDMASPVNSARPA